MAELLQQALVVTVWGMGVTFATLGALVLGMYALTALLKDAPESAMDAALDAAPTPALPDARQLAAVAAVAVALATAQPAVVAPAPTSAAQGWSGYARNQALNRLTQHQSRRARR